MKDFFDRQESARKKTVQLIILFVLAVILIIVCVYVVITSFYLSFLLYENGSIGSSTFWSPIRFFIIFILTLILIFCGSLYKISELKGGGYRIAEMLGGRLISRGTTNLEEERLLNIVEEMAIASGVPVPDVYVMDKEGGINAFAAGFSINDAVICVTKGGLHLLNRDELQGVVAHEFSHILNSDTSINIRLMGWLHGILLISLIGEGILRGMRHTRGRGSLGLAVFGIALFILGYVGMFFGKLIKSSISRQREYLADASAVQFTRNPSGLAGALKKIGGLTFGSQLSHPRVSEASHMYFGNGLGGNMLALMSTHPPLLKRIKCLDPYFNGVFPKVKSLPMVEPEIVRDISPKKPVLEAPQIITGAMAMAILQTIGSPMKEHADLAKRLFEELPDPVRKASRDPLGACALIYVLLLDMKEDIRIKQINLLREYEIPEIISETEKLENYRGSLSPRVRLPLVDMAIPSLRNLSEKQYNLFKDNIHRLVIADRKLSLFEYVLSYVLIHRLDAHFKRTKKKVAQIYALRGVSDECSLVLSLFAHLGSHNDEEAVKAFEHGKKIIQEPKVELKFLPSKECTLKELDRTLEKLVTTSPMIKKKLLAACLECLTFDKKITVQEAELFRAVAYALDCPVPPWLLQSE